MKYTAGISVTCDTVELQTRAMRVMTGVGCDLAAHFTDMTVHAYSTDPDEEEFTEEGSDVYFDQMTMFKVLTALTNGGVTLQFAQKLVDSMQNAGILFRERVPAKEPVRRTTLRCAHCPHMVWSSDFSKAEQLLNSHILENHKE